MHKIALTLSLAISLAGCVHRPIAIDNDFESPYPQQLEARLLSPFNERLRFVTSEPAYVAIFEIVPDRGVSMLYPTSREGMTRLSSAGLNTTLMPFHVIGRSFYSDAPFYYAMSGFTKPKYLYMIASRYPLPLDDLRRSPGSLRNALGWRSFLANDLSGTLDDIERLVAGSIPETDWTSDVYVIWPEIRSNRPWQSSYMFMRCDDGRRVLVPVEWNIHACPGTTRLAQATRPPTPPDTKPQPPGTIPESDTTEQQPPPNIRGGPRRPQPAPPPTRMPGDAPIGRTGRADRADRGGPRSGAQRPTERQPSPAPAARPDSPRPSPEPRAEVPRSESPRSEPRPAEPVERQPAPGKPADKR